MLILKIFIILFGLLNKPFYVCDMKALYKKKDYAKLKGVSPQYISKIRKKLKTKVVGNYEFVVDCPKNDKLFKIGNKSFDSYYL